MRNFVQPGKVITAVAPTGGVVSGGFVKIGAIFGIATTTAAEGTPFELQTGEVHELPKTSAEAWAFGDVIYATSANIMTTTASGNTKVGVAVAVAANPSGSGLVRLNSSF
jgi:predicted RecA/RadA family phage recombinase